MAAHQAPPSLGFSRQEYWSGLPFPFPVLESEVTQSCLTLHDPVDYSLPGSSIHGIFQARVLEWVAISFSKFNLIHDLTFQVPMQYCSLHHRTLLSSPTTSTTEHLFHFSPDTSSFLELLLTDLCSSPEAYWTPSDLGGLIFQCHIFLPFHAVHGILTARILMWFAICSSSRRCFVRILNYDLPVLDGLAGHGL